MNTEVAHDDAYNNYLEELNAAEKGSRFMRIVEKAVLVIATVTLIVSYVVFVPLVAFFKQVDARGIHFMAIIAPVVVYFILDAIWMRRRRKVSRKYLHRLLSQLPDGYPIAGIKIRYGGGVNVECDGVTYYCNLRELAETNGEGGWNVLRFSGQASGSFEELKVWADSRPGVVQIE